LTERGLGRTFVGGVRVKIQLRLILTFSLIAVCFCSNQPKKIESRYPTGGYDKTGRKEELAEALTFQGIFNLIKDQKLEKVESVLEAISKTHPEYVKFHTLMYSSQSLHDADFENPRGLVFGPDAKLIITFNGSTKYAGGNAIELVEYNSEASRFEFREIEFKNEKLAENLGGLPLEQSDIEFENDLIKVSKPNPQKCLNCHGANANPIWFSYFVWPGAFGSNDDHLTMSFDRSSWNQNNEDFFEQADRPHSQGRYMVLAKAERDPEVDGYIRYLKSKKNHPRYRWLPQRFGDGAFIAWAGGEEEFVNLDRSDEARGIRKTSGLSYSWPSRPNSFFQEQLMKLNQARVIAQLDKKGLKGSLNGMVLRGIYPTEATGDSDQRIKLMVDEISAIFQKMSWIGKRPNKNAIESTLRIFLRDEVLDQLEKLKLHEEALKPQKLKLPEYSSTVSMNRFHFEWIGDPVAFYSEFLGRTKFSDRDRIALHLEAVNVAEVVVLHLFLLDRGVDLVAYNMNFRQQSPNFHNSGLELIKAYLGVNH
jgi:hypothetical protein